LDAQDKIVKDFARRKKYKISKVYWRKQSKSQRIAEEFLAVIAY